MDKNELINQANRIKQLNSEDTRTSTLVEAKEFLKIYGGKDNEFYKRLDLPIKSWPDLQFRIDQVLDAFIRYVENGLLRTVSLEREIQIDTVSDYLEQAENLLNTDSIHPAAATIIIGASLEEFCRNWLEEQDVDVTSIKMTLDSYSNELLSKKLITKQDKKDINSWGGLRNSAAHGKWNEVENKEVIKLMLQGVNLFLRKYGK